MKRGKTEPETVRLNEWKVGDILEGDEGYGPSRILITAVGRYGILCLWDDDCTGEWGLELSTTLSCREWVKVGEEKKIDNRSQSTK